MKKNLTNNLLRELIDTEFIFVKTRTKLVGLNTVISKINLKKKNQFNVLDLLELNTSLKQLFKILFSLKYSKNVFTSQFIVYIWCTNPFILNLIDLFLKDYNLSKNVLVISSFPILDNRRDIRKQKLLLVLGNPWMLHSTKLVSRILRNNIFLINTFNFKIENQLPGFYKIQNDLSDYKKLIVLLIIIDSIFSNKCSINLNRAPAIKNFYCSDAISIASNTTKIFNLKQ